jgi:MATE family multidrug resistance protein
MSKIYSLYRLYRFELKNTILFSIPIVIAQLGVVLMGVIDTLMIRDLGVVATAAAGATNDTFFLITMLSIGSMNIIAPLISQAFQKKDMIEAKKTWLAGLLLALVLGIITMLILWLVIENFHLLKQEELVTKETQIFLWQLWWSVIPILVFLACKQFTDGLSMTKVAMTLTWVGLASNVLFNWLLIHGNWGLPAMGLKGAGLATTISRIIMMIAILIFIFINQQTKSIVRVGIGKIEGAFIWKVFRLGLPVGLTYFLEVAAFSVAGLLIGSIDRYSQAAHRVVISLVSTTYMITSGISIASAIRIGKMYAELNISKIKRIGTTSIILAILIMATFCMMFLSVPEAFILPLIENDPKAVPIAVSLLIVAGFFQISDGVQAVGLGILRGMEDVNIPTVIALIAYWVIALPLSILAYVQGWGALGIWVALLLGLTTSALLLTNRFYKLLKHKKQQMA